MNKVILFHLLFLMFACNQATENTTTTDTSTKTDIEPETDVEPKIEKEVIPVEIKTLFSLSPLSIFDDTTEGLSAAEKEDLLNKGESDTWKITEETKTKLTIQCKHPSSEVTLRFLQHKDDADGLLFASIINERNTNLHSWKYSHADKTLDKVDVLKKYTANDFVSKEDKLPDSYKAILNYQFVDDQTIEVLLQTWMDQEFENREIANKIFLRWNGADFEEKIKQIKE